MTPKEIKTAIEEVLDMCESQNYTTSECIESFKVYFQYANEDVFSPILKKFRRGEISREDALHNLMTW